LNHDLFKVSPLNAQLGLDALFGRLNRDIFANYVKEMKKPNSMTLRLQAGLAEMNAVYNQCRDNDSRLADPRELPMLTFEKVVELRARLDQAANAIENGELSKHKFTRLGGADPRQQLKEALTKTDPDWPRTPLQEMKLLISQRLDRLEARALAKQADLDALGSRLVEQEELEVMLGSEFGDDDNVLVSEDLRATERRNMMFNQRPQELE
jgi:hypothetical protein